MSTRISAVVLWSALGMSALLLSSACSSSNDSSSSSTANNAPIVKTEPAKTASDKGDQVVTGGDLAFLNDAAPGGMVEVELGRIAVKQAANAEVKKFGQRMIDDHTKAGDALKLLAGQKKVMLSPDLNPSHKETIAKLEKLKGADFDKAYVKAMVEDHEKDVAAFEATANGAVDQDVKAFAAKTLPTLKEHLEMIRAISAKMDAGAKP